MEKMELPKTNSVVEKISQKVTKLDMSKAVALALAVGFAGTIIGAIIWFLIAALLDLQIGYVAILIGALVGFGMKAILRDTNSLSLGLVAAVIAVFGLILGNFMIWFFLTPGWQKEAFAEESGVEIELVNELVSDAEVRAEYSFVEYMKDDLSNTEGGHNPIISVLFYFLAIIVSFGKVFDWRNTNRTV